MVAEKINGKGRIFDDFEMRLLELISSSQSKAAQWAERAQKEYDSDKDALYSYVNHMHELAKSKAYMQALDEYRTHLAHRGTEYVSMESVSI